MAGHKDTVSIVVAHGAFHKASHYDSLIAHLREVGLNRTLVPQLPSAEPPYPDDAYPKDVTAIQKAITEELRIERDVLLVTHSYGGIPGCEALRGLAIGSEKNMGNVIGIVFVSAFVAEEGQSLREAKAGAHATWIRREGKIAYVNEPEDTLFNTVSDYPLRASLATDLTGQALSAFGKPVSFAGWKHFPTYYVRCLEDHANELMDQDHFISRLRQGGTLRGIKELPSDHCPMVGMPSKLAELIKEVVDSSET